MKSFSILFTFIVLCFGTSLAQDTKAAQKPPKKVYGGKDDNCMLNGSYDKPLTISSMNKNKAEVSLQKSDYVQFNADGSYNEVINGVASNGTWSYNEGTKKITVVCNGTKTYDVISQKNGVIELNDGTTSMSFSKI